MEVRKSGKKCDVLFERPQTLTKQDWTKRETDIESDMRQQEGGGRDLSIQCGNCSHY